MTEARGAGAAGRGLFVVFEGPEGSGKSTQIALLAERLRDGGVDPVTTREPGGSPASDAIRTVLLDPRLTIHPLPEFLLYSASRAQHVDEVVRPALGAGRVVISDRFAGASVAYQGYGRGLDLGFVRSITERVTGGIAPDLTVLLDLEPALGLERIASRGERDRLERADLEFHRRVRDGFLRQAEADGSWVTLDATQEVEVLAERVFTVVRGELERRAALETQR